MLRLKDVPWLDDHRLLPDPVFPAAGYIAMAIEATPQLHEGANGAQAIVGVTLRNISIKSTMQAPTNEIGVETILDMHPVDLNYLKGSMEWYELSISSILSNGETWTKHCSGTIRVETYSNGWDLIIQT